MIACLYMREREMAGGNRKSDRGSNKKSGVGGGGFVDSDDAGDSGNATATFDPVEFRKSHSEFVSQLKIKHLYPLVGEVDRCLKKVGEGLESVEDVWEKFMTATIPSQKEKYEAELKKEIKKLQRLREQIKSWIALADIKDKTMLSHTKRLIETQMERFKEIEREMKIKTYSKVGLESEQKVDPVVKDVELMNGWIAGSIEQLGIQIDHLECEIESLLSDRKRRSQQNEMNRLERLQNDIERHRFHIDKLETLMKMLDDQASDVNFDVCRLKKFLGQVKKIQDDVNYYIESNQEPDYEYNEYVFSDIEGIEEFEQCLASSACLSTGGHDDTGIGSNTSEANPPSPSAPVDTVVDVPFEPVIKKTLVPAKTRQINGVASTEEVTPAKITRLLPGELPSQRELHSSFKDVVARSSLPSFHVNGTAAVGSATTATTTSTKVSRSSSSKNLTKGRSSSHGISKKRESKPAKRSGSASHVSGKTSRRSEKAVSEINLVPPTVKENGKPTTYRGALANHCDIIVGKSPLKVAEIHRDVNGNDCILSDHVKTEAGLSAVANGTGTCQYLECQTIPDMDCGSETHPSGLISPDLAVEEDFDSFEGPVGYSTPRPVHQSEPESVPETKEAYVHPLKAVAPLGQVELSTVQIRQFQILEGSQRKLQETGQPLYSTLEPQGQLISRQAYDSPSYYPQWPLQHMGTTDFYSKLAIETLFFIFYYSGNSKAQYMAAKELKKQMWRFHKKELIWFQRCDQPEVTTEEYEKGLYYYFDLDEWSQKKKIFTFEYKYLEDIEL